MVFINASKSNAMLVTTRNKIAQLKEWDLNVFLGDDTLIQIDCADYLGIKLDQHISWNDQVNNLYKKLFFKISKLHRLKPILPTHILVKIYNGIIQPTIDYAITVWGYTTQHNLKKIQRLRNRAARIITGNVAFINTGCTDLVSELGWMTVIQRRDYVMVILMFKCIRGLAPHYLSNEITMQIELTDRLTRSVNENNVYVPYAPLESFRNSFAFRGPAI